MIQRLWDGFRSQPVHVVCWAVFIAVFAWAAERSFPTAFDPDGQGSGARGSDFVYYFKGAEAVWNGTDPYARFDFGHRIGHAYNYPPMVAIVLSPLVPLGIVDAARVWFCLNVALAMSLVLGSFWLVARRFELSTDALSWGAVLSLSAVVGIEVIRREIDDLQTDTIMLASIAGMLLCMDRRTKLLGLSGAIVWPALAGLTLAIGVHVKFLLLIFLPYLLVSNRISTLGWTVFWTAGLFFLTSLVLGWEQNLRAYAISLGGASRILGFEVAAADLAGRVHDLTWHNSVSLPSMIARVLAGESTKDLTDSPPEYSSALVFAALGLIALATVAVAWWLYSKHGYKLFASFWQASEKHDPDVRDRLALTEVCMMIVVQLCFSPQTMKRHMFLAMPVVVLASSLALLPRRGARRIPAGVGLAVLLAAMTLPPGGESTRELVEWWKWHSGVGWGLLLFAFLTLWSALSASRAIDRGEELADPPPARVRWFTRRAA